MYVTLSLLLSFHLYIVFLAFACNDKLLLSLTHESGIAFSNLPRNELYVPAVSVFMGEQVRMILTSIKVSI